MDSNILIQGADEPRAHLNGAGVDLARVPPPPKASLDDPAIREEARRRYAETTESNEKIAWDLGVAKSTLSRIAKREAWPRPDGAPRTPAVDPKARRKLAATLADAGAVSARLLRAVDRQIGMIDRRLRKKDALIEEKDARILTGLAKTLATLMALETDDGATARKPEPADRGELQAELARRIRQWAEEGEGPA